jgi:hypothetical protein
VTESTDENDQEPPAAGLVLWTESAEAPRAPSPALVAFSGKRAALRTIEFLTAGIHNEHTRRAYHRAARRFLAWCNARGRRLDAVRSPDVAIRSSLDPAAAASRICARLTLRTAILPPLTSASS